MWSYTHKKLGVKLNKLNNQNKTKSHSFINSYEYEVIFVGSGIANGTKKDLKCSNCGITEFYFNQLSNLKLIKRTENELNKLKNLPPAKRSIHYHDALQDTLQRIGRIKLANDCELYKNSIK